MRSTTSFCPFLTDRQPLPFLSSSYPSVIFLSNGLAILVPTRPRRCVDTLLCAADSPCATSQLGYNAHKCTILDPRNQTADTICKTRTCKCSAYIRVRCTRPAVFGTVSSFTPLSAAQIWSKRGEPTSRYQRNAQCRFTQGAPRVTSAPEPRAQAALRWATKHDAPKTSTGTALLAKNLTYTTQNAPGATEASDKEILQETFL